MTDRDAADAVMDAACSPDFIHGKHMHGIGGASQNRDCKHCAAVRAAVEQYGREQRQEELRDVRSRIPAGTFAAQTVSEHIGRRLAELERQRGAR